jgi:hypothetical protein
MDKEEMMSPKEWHNKKFPFESNKDLYHEYEEIPTAPIWDDIMIVKYAAYYAKFRQRCVQLT